MLLALSKSVELQRIAAMGRETVEDIRYKKHTRLTEIAALTGIIGAVLGIISFVLQIVNK